MASQWEQIDPAAEGLPHVLALSSDGYQAQAKWSPFHGGLLRPDPDLPATHYMDGIVAIDAFNGTDTPARIWDAIEARLRA